MPGNSLSSKSQIAPITFNLSGSLKSTDATVNATGVKDASQTATKQVTAHSRKASGNTTPVPNHPYKRRLKGPRGRSPKSDQKPSSHFKLFVGNLGKEVTSEMLEDTFKSYGGFVNAHVAVDHRTGRSKGFGFVSFLNSDDYFLAYREKNDTYVGSQPILLKKATS